MQATYFFYTSFGKTLFYGPSIVYWTFVILEKVWASVNFSQAKSGRAYKATINWQQFEKGPHVGVMVRCPLIFSHIFYMLKMFPHFFCILQIRGVWVIVRRW